MSFSLKFLVIFCYIGLIYGQDTDAPYTYDCRTKRSGLSGPHDDNQASIGCDSGYKLVSCSVRTNWGNNHDGSFTRNGRCYCQAGGGGGGCYAYARCCKVTDSDGVQVLGQCSETRGRKSDNHDDARSLSTCPNKSYLTGCSAYTYWKKIDGSCPGKGNCYENIKQNKKTFGNEYLKQCTAVNGVQGDGVYANAQCCSLNTNKYALRCEPFYGSKSATYDDALSEAICPNGWYLSGCSGYSPWRCAEGIFIENNKCYAQNAVHCSGVYAIATCCKLVYNINWNTCNVIDWNFIENKQSIKELLFSPIQNPIEYTYSNNQPNSQDLTGTFSIAKCEDVSTTTSQTTSFEIGISATTSFKFFGNEASLTVETKVSHTTSKSVTKNTQVCETLNIAPPICPPYSFCKREYTRKKVLQKLKDIEYLLQCETKSKDIVRIKWKGKIEIKGDIQIFNIKDTFRPLGCIYYTDNYNDRRNKLPFCETCSNNKYCSKCVQSSSAPVLLVFNSTSAECISENGCANICRGIVKGTHKYCENPRISDPICINYLFNIAHINEANIKL